jgi:hypothetical protein
MIKEHITKWSSVYLRGFLYAFIAVGTEFCSRTENISSSNLDKLVWWDWLRIVMFSLLSGAVAIRAFLDSSVADTKNDK